LIWNNDLEQLHESIGTFDDFQLKNAVAEAVIGMDAPIDRSGTSRISS
jgi:hypothetical protein